MANTPPLPCPRGLWLIPKLYIIIITKYFWINVSLTNLFTNLSTAVVQSISMFWGRQIYIVLKNLVTLKVCSKESWESCGRKKKKRRSGEAWARISHNETKTTMSKLKCMHYNSISRHFPLHYLTNFWHVVYMYVCIQ